MRTKDPTEHPDESISDVCPVPNCRRDLTDEGDCPEHGNESDWRRLAAEERALPIRDEYLDVEDDE